MRSSGGKARKAARRAEVVEARPDSAARQVDGGGARGTDRRAPSDGQQAMDMRVAIVEGELHRTQEDVRRLRADVEELGRRLGELTLSLEDQEEWPAGA